MTTRPHPSQFSRQFTRQVVETVVILVVAAIVHEIWRAGVVSPAAVCWIVAALALAKTAYFFVENLQHILLATSHEIPYHRFLALMGVNMAQITVSFTLDFFLLEAAEPESFAGFTAGLGEPRILFDCFFYSLLNFTFFGFGDITPQSIAAKLVTLMEVTLAFFTVIFLLSDFISLKDSLRGK
jgi:Na+/H+ antiporter NhaD/arsenite permease-like protein